MTEIIIVRHGETNENKLGICQGHTEGTLSEEGKNQNRILAENLRDFGIRKIYSSPLMRAVETGNEIWKLHKDVELQKDIRLIEWNMGVLQGHKFPKDFDISKPAKGMENLELVRTRVCSFLDEIIPMHGNQTIAVVSHGLTIKVMTTVLMDIPIEDAIRIKLMENSSFSVFDY